MISVPGYDKKVPFGELTYFAYPVENSGMAIMLYVLQGIFVLREFAKFLNSFREFVNSPDHSGITQIP